MMRSSTNPRAMTWLCMAAAAGVTCSTAIAQVQEQKIDQKYQPNLLPIASMSEAPPPPAQFLENLKPEQSFIVGVPLNDDCSNAEAIGSLPAFVPGSTNGATFDNVGFCGTGNTAPGVWYTVTGTGNNMLASFCAAGGTADYDTKLSVFCGTCDDLFCVTGNDDTCGLLSEVSWCSTAGQTYYILVHGFSSQTGTFILAVDDLGTSCSDAVACEPCPFACDPGATPEGEQTCSDGYVDQFNGGCNSTPPVFSPIDCGETVCGTSGTFTSALGDTRDTDWYRLDLATAQIVTWEVTGSFPVLMGIVDNGGIDDCTGVGAFLISGTADACDTVSVSASLTPGTWWLFVSPSEFTGVNCGAEYQGTVTCADPPTGACCLPDATCIDGLTVEESDLLGGVYQGDGTNCGDVTCQAFVEGADFCDDAGEVPVPSLTFGTTIGATTDNVPFCGTPSTSPGVWYGITGTGNTITVSLCGPSTQYDSKISVYCGGCDTLTCVVGNDDFCGLQSEVSFCSQNGAEYLILVHGFGGQSGNFELDVYDDGFPCTATIACLPVGACCGAEFVGCTHTVQMFDSFGDGWNGATMDVLVNGSPVLMGIFATGSGSDATFAADTGDVITTVYSTGAFENENTYQILDGVGIVIGSDGPSPGSGITATGNCEVPPGCIHTAQMFDSFGDGWNGATMDVLVNGSPVLTGISASGTGSSENFFADTGDVITTVYSTGAFEDENSYSILDGAGNVIGSDGPFPGPGITATGFCPDDGGNGGGGADCFVLSEADCVAAGGVWQGAGASCGGFAYEVATCGNGFEDITGLGIPLGLSDDSGVVVPIGFDFEFYGTNHTEIAVCSNGYLTFGTDLTDFSNDAIPDSNDPNDMIAVLWDDFNPAAGGSVHYATLGTSPNRRFIAQWTFVPQFGNNDQNTFEAILYEGSNVIEYRYFLITPEAFAGDYTIGIENADGTDGEALATSSIIGGECFTITPNVGGNPCDNPPVCPVGVEVAIWPPNHGYTTFDLNSLAGVTDPDGDTVIIAIVSIRQDEPVNDLGDGNTNCDGEDLGGGLFRVRTERSGTGNGRVYHINYSATDPSGNECLGTVLIKVPHSQAMPAIDDGPNYDSMWCGDDADVNMDFQVNDLDLQIVIDTLGQSGPDATLNWPDGDVDHDGTVTATDVQIVLDQIGPTTGIGFTSPRKRNNGGSLGND